MTQEDSRPTHHQNHWFRDLQRRCVWAKGEISRTCARATGEKECALLKLTGFRYTGAKNGRREFLKKLPLNKKEIGVWRSKLETFD